MLCFPLTRYDLRMREKPFKAQPLSLVENLDSRLLLRVLSDFRKGDFSARLPVHSVGVAGKIYDTINEIIELNSRLTEELERISTVVGKEGKFRHRATLTGATGGWADSIDSVNSLVDDLSQPIIDVSRVIGAVANGDLSQTMAQEVEGRSLTGEFLRTAKTVNTMVDKLSTFTSEVIRVAREVGTEGKLDGQANVPSAAGTWRDLTDNVNHMAAALTQLALTSKYKSEFLANMSHELRTPMNCMLILSRLLGENEEGNLSPKQVEYAQTIHSSGDDLLALINEILDLSKIESGTMDVENKRVLTADVREYVEKNFGAVAQSKGLKFAVDVRPNAPKALFTDQQRLQQILKNLLANAFKFTHEGNVILRIEQASGGWSAGHKVLDRADQVVAFSVIDTGIGISADKHRIIFEAFQQADSTTSRKYGGTGLGLSISRESANLLGGEIRVVSAPGEGSMFTLYLPRKSPLPLGGGRRVTIKNAPSPERLLAETSLFLHRAPKALPDAKRRMLEQEQRADPLLAGKKVLVIDDDVRNIFSLTSLLERHRMEVLFAENGRDGIELLMSAPGIDAILVDVMMPEMDGYETMRKIRKLRRFKSIPMIALTAKAMKRDREKCIEAGASDYISKPADVDRLLSLLRVYLVK